MKECCSLYLFLTKFCGQSSITHSSQDSSLVLIFILSSVGSQCVILDSALISSSSNFKLVLTPGQSLKYQFFNCLQKSYILVTKLSFSDLVFAQLSFLFQPQKTEALPFQSIIKITVNLCLPHFCLDVNLYNLPCLFPFVMRLFVLFLLPSIH